ncbi:VanZ family protein [Paenibacillus sp. sgz500958]|uniref:VanZ family protein n=1 Tax=Paenibacillus sp. sgz500958 TaxID=3242475 RepID=UPI0036D3DE74
MKRPVFLIKVLLAVLFAVYLYFLIRLILFKWGSVDIQLLLDQLHASIQHPDRIFDRPGNYTPFKEIKRDMDSISLGNPFASTNLLGNILAFIPLGFFLPNLFKPQAITFMRVFMISLGLSLSFEVTQLLLYIGTFDVDDLILNTFGGVMGYCVLRIFYDSKQRVDTR